MTQEYYINSVDKERTAFTVGSSESGRREQVYKGLVSTDSVQETRRIVKSGGLGYAQARRLAAMLTERQRRDIVRLALVIQAFGPEKEVAT